MLVAVRNDTDIAEALLKHGADPNLKDGAGRTAADIAKEANYDQLSRLLAPKPQTDAAAGPLHEAAKRCDLDRVGELVAQGADVSAVGHSVGETVKGTPLHFAAIGDCVPVAEHLLSHRAQVNAAGDFGMTALHLAAQFEHAGMTRVLIANGADVNAGSVDGARSLHLAVASESEALVASSRAARSSMPPTT
jgi:ankyrin repeat protein